MKKKFPFKKQKSKKNYLVFSILLTLIIVSSFGVYNTFQSEKIVVGEKNENKTGFPDNRREPAGKQIFKNHKI